MCDRDFDRCGGDAGEAREEVAARERRKSGESRGRRRKACADQKTQGAGKDETMCEKDSTR